MTGQHRVLIVDDDENMRAALTEAISRMGYPVDTASDGVSGLNMLDAGEYALVVTDFRMPRKNGLDLLGEIKNKKPATYVVVITAYGTIETAVEAMKLGANDYLMKPFSADTLEKVLKKAITGGTRQQPQIKRPPTPAEAPSKKGRAIVTVNKKMLDILEIAERTAPSKASVLIHGESGTGKELVARYIHEKSDRASGPFIAINCAALPESLLESELFGHEKGSFTGAISRKIGKFEQANGGTILLDEITEMQMELQAKLLRVLQEKEIDRVGGSAPIPIDVRVIATTNRKIEEAISGGKFREDLYFRLNVIPLHLPPMRERPDDIPMLARHFMEKFSKDSASKAAQISDGAMEVLKKCRWKGNVRELENVMERAVLLCRTDTISPADLFLTSATMEEPGRNEAAVSPGETIEEMEKRLILGTLSEVGDNRTKAADMLGISIRTLRNKLNTYKLEKKTG